MFAKRNQLMIVLLGVLCLTALSLTGCKKEPESVKPPETAVAEVAEQTVCPVMEGEINKEIFVEYEGKNVYFCCPGCEETFLKEPEKYLSKLPQFQE